MAKMTYSGYVEAGWACVGLLNSMKELAFMLDVDFQYVKHSSFVGRTITYKLNGERANVEKYIGTMEGALRRWKAS